MHAVITSPPYWGLRDYATGEQKKHELGAEVHHDCLGWATGISCGECFVCHARQYAEEIWRVLRHDGTFWLNLGDSYAGSGGAGDWSKRKAGKQEYAGPQNNNANRVIRSKRIPRGAGSGRWGGENVSVQGLPRKNLVGIPWRVALALQADGWILRQDIVWNKCLSGGVKLYAKTQNTEGPHILKDLVRLDPSTVKLWNGERWTQVKRWIETPRPPRPLEITLRSGERIGCTPEHRWPTQRGLVEAKDLQIGDILDSCVLPEANYPSPSLIPCSVGWFVGLYIAEGSMSGKTIQISGHKKEKYRYERVKKLVSAYGGKARLYYSGENGANIHINCAPILAILKMYVSGRTAKDKRLSPRCWMRSNSFLLELLDGYLSGDGHKEGNRWRIGFTRNYELESDLRSLCARFGFQLRLKPTEVNYQGGTTKAFRGEIRKHISNHPNVKSDTEVMSIRGSRARRYYDIAVEDDPHLFSLASGVLTHNSNCMPESVKDRCTKAHEYVFLFSKGEKYYFDHYAIKEKVAESTAKDPRNIYGRHTDGDAKWADADDADKPSWYRKKTIVNKVSKADTFAPRGKDEELIPGQGAVQHRDGRSDVYAGKRNKRSVWSTPTKGFKGAHFACFPPSLITPMIRAATSEYGVCAACGAPWKRVVKKGYRAPADEEKIAEMEAKGVPRQKANLYGHHTRDPQNYAEDPDETIGWEPTCKCGTDDVVPATVFDPFSGAATTAMVANQLGRRGLGLELSGDYIDLSKERVGMNALAGWESAIQDNGSSLDELPLFGEMG